MSLLPPRSRPRPFGKFPETLAHPVRGAFGARDKSRGARRIMRRPHESDFGDATEADRWFSIGDSANDRWVFECFAAGVGAANPMQWVDAPGTWRACLSKAECAAGFAEVTWRVVAARRAADAS